MFCSRNIECYSVRFLVCVTDFIYPLDKELPIIQINSMLQSLEVLPILECFVRETLNATVRNFLSVSDFIQFAKTGI